MNPLGYSLQDYLGRPLTKRQRAMAEVMSHTGQYANRLPPDAQAWKAQADEIDRRNALAVAHAQLSDGDVVSAPPVNALMKQPTAFDQAMARWTGPDEGANVTNALTDVLGSQFAGGLVPAAQRVKTSGLMSLFDPRIPSSQVNAGLPRKSKAQLIEEGYYHPIGAGKKLKTLIDDMEFTQVPVKDLPGRQIISPEDLLGSSIVPATGDRTAAGSILTSVGGNELPTPVMLEGGPDFMRTHLDVNNPEQSAAWASGKGVISSLGKRIRNASEGGRDVNMVYVPMGHVGGDFSTMMSDAILEQAKTAKITKKAKKAFDDGLRNLRPEWKGLDHPMARDQLNANGELRHAFISRAKLEASHSAGFPDLATTRAAITEPSLMDTPMHHGGFSIARVDPTGRVIDNPTVPHTSYDTQLAGQYRGGFERPVPREILFPRFTAARRAAGGDPSRDHRAFQLSNPTELADQQWLDGVMNYLNR